MKKEKPVIRRYFDYDVFPVILKDFGFLPRVIKSLGDEVYISIRENYFNIYSRGNSLAKIIPKNGNGYSVKIHNSFLINNSLLQQFKACLIKSKKSSKYTEWFLLPKNLRAFFSKKNLIELCKKIKLRDFSEELLYEQMIINDNYQNADHILIDRQIKDKKSKYRLDILELTRLKENEYHFTVLELKLGKNPDLLEKVKDQINKYVEHVGIYFADYKKSYEINYKQQREWSLLDNSLPKEISIVLPVKGKLIVAGYSKKAADQLKTLKGNYDDLDCEELNYKLAKNNKNQ